MQRSETKTEAILLGYSGHGYVVAEAAIESGVTLLGYAEKQKCIENPYQLLYLGDETNNKFDWNISKYYALAVGSNTIRKMMFQRVGKNNGKCLSIIHPTANITLKSQVGEGSFIARNVAINPLVSIGNCVILNTGCTIDHESIIDDYVHVAPGAVICGNVIVENGAFIGANSVIKEGVRIGERAIIGAGSVVIKNVSADNVVAGNPSKIIRFHHEK